MTEQAEPTQADVSLADNEADWKPLATWQIPSIIKIPLDDTQSGGGAFFENDGGQFQPS